MCFFLQAEDGIRYLVRSRGLGDVYKRQFLGERYVVQHQLEAPTDTFLYRAADTADDAPYGPCLLYTSDAADERSSVDLGGRRIIKKKNTRNDLMSNIMHTNQTQASHQNHTTHQ